MKTLIVDDDFFCRKLLKKFLSPYGECDMASGGDDAILAFKTALDEGNPYDLICLDIMMPNMDGHAVLREIRRIESEMSIEGLEGVKIIMISALSDSKNIMNAFKSGCESFIVKPIDKNKVFFELEKLGLSIPITN